MNWIKSFWNLFNKWRKRFKRGTKVRVVRLIDPSPNLDPDMVKAFIGKEGIIREYYLCDGTYLVWFKKFDSDIFDREELEVIK